MVQVLLARSLTLMVFLPPYVVVPAVVRNPRCAVTVDPPVFV